MKNNIFKLSFLAGLLTTAMSVSATTSVAEATAVWSGDISTSTGTEEIVITGANGSSTIGNGLLIVQGEELVSVKNIRLEAHLPTDIKVDGSSALTASEVSWAVKNVGLMLNGTQKTGVSWDIKNGNSTLASVATDGTVSATATTGTSVDLAFASNNQPFGATGVLKDAEAGSSASVAVTVMASLDTSTEE